jgi:hypothetical protein
MLSWPLSVLPLSSASRLSTSVARPQVQVVTHLCYSDFQDIMKAVDDMDGEGDTRTHTAVGVGDPMCSQHHVHHTDSRWMVCVLPVLLPLVSQALLKPESTTHTAGDSVGGGVVGLVRSAAF